ncbi:hypothetical protein [Azospirillum melinis]
MSEFKGRHFEGEIVLWRLRPTLSLRDPAEILLPRSACHPTHGVFLQSSTLWHGS